MPLENSPPFPHNVSNGKPLNNQDIPQNYRGTWSFFFFARTSKNPRPSNVWASSAELWLRGGVFSPLLPHPFLYFKLVVLSLGIIFGSPQPSVGFNIQNGGRTTCQPNTSVLHAYYNGGPVLLRSFSNFHILITSKWGYKWRNFCQISQKCHGWNILVDRGFLLISKLSQTIVCGWYWAHWLLPTN